MYNEFNENNNKNFNEEIENDILTEEYTDSKGYYELSTDIYEKPKRKKAFKPIMKFVAIALAFGIISGASFQGYNSVMYNINNKKTPEASQTSNEFNGIDKAYQDVATTVSNSVEATGTSGVSDIVENVMPSIVSINATISSTVTDMFGRQYNSENTGSGSGIIVGQNNTEILIVTNNHVVADSTKLEVTFDDETIAEATVKGTDSKSDLAVIAVPLSGLSSETLANIKIATLGESSSMKVGELAIAIGNALGYGQSVTVGVISAVNREIDIDNTKMTLIQTDAAINPGNSGGALLNAKGAVIGINSVKFASEQVEGMGYAIPISSAIPIINELMNKEEIPESEQAYLGISGQAVTEAYASRFNMPIGYYISEIGRGSPAEISGLSVGDIIVSISGNTVEDEFAIKEILSNHRSGDVVEIICKTLRNGEYVEKAVEVTLGSRSQ